MKTSNNGIDLIKHFEGCETEAYLCPAGVWTIGYGHIKGVQEGDVITEQQAHDMLVEELEEYEGYIKDFFIEKTENNKTSLKISLKYYEGDPVIKEIKRISKPGRRVYSRATSIPKVMNGLGLAILSTPKGVMSDVEARKNNVGGEIICRVF